MEGAMDAIGAPVLRKDGRAKVTGQARYAAEAQAPGVAHAVLVQSTIAAGSVIAVETGAAAAMPGVLAIIKPQNAPRLRANKPAPQFVPGPALQDDSVAFNGQHVAVVVADTLERAQAAAARVGVRYRQGEAVTEMAQAMADAYPPKEFRNGTRPPDSQRGDPDGAFAAASVKLAATYTTPIEHHNPMEPHATVARWDGDKLTVFTATQYITGARTTLAKMFGLPPENVRVVCPFTGGGFGCKGNTWPPVTLAAMAARVVGRPVKLVLDRRQMYTSNGYRPRTVQHLKLAAAADGRLVALRHHGFSQMSLGDFGEFSEPVGLASEMLYAVPNAAVTHRLVPVNQGLPTYMRAPGESSGVFALESAMDELAAQLDLDPLALRLKNHADTDPHENLPFSSKKLRECYHRGAEAFGWSRRAPAPRAMRDGRVLVGWGMATAVYPANRSACAATVRINADGTVLVRCGTQELGTGTYTIMAQVAAAALGVPVARVSALLGDSRFPHAPVSGGSQTAASVTNAVHEAATTLRSRLFTLAQADARSGIAGTDPGAMRLQDGAVIAGPRRVTVAELLAHRNADFLEVMADSRPGEEKQHYSLHAFGAHFVEVRVDPDLGEIRVARIVSAFDAGRVLNARTARSQLIGGIVYGLGMALFEHTLVDPETGRYVNANLAEYLVPVNADVPEIQTILVENDERTTNPLGVKGMGELPMVGVAPAVANAVCHATGKRVRDLPIRLEDVLA
jgi:xanthine dehydrogenase YagR molybdenum-binding subunit